MSKSIISRSRIRPSSSSSRHTIIASKVKADSHRPLIIVSRPASIRLAIAISPSRESSSTTPISRRYIRTGSSVRSSSSLEFPPLTAVVVVRASVLEPSVSSSTSSITEMPRSESCCRATSISSAEIPSILICLPSSSVVKRPDLRATATIRLVSTCVISSLWVRTRGLAASAAAASIRACASASKAAFFSLAVIFLAAGFLAAVFFAVVFLSAAFAAVGFLAAGFLVAAFLAAGFLAAGFFAVVLVAAFAIYITPAKGLT